MEFKARFKRFSTAASRATGRPATFALAVGTVIVWAVSGPLFRFSDTWQLVINTGTTIVTFLMVFLIQNTQNRDSAAMHIKMDEVIRALGGAHNAVLDLEELGDEELEKVRQRYEAIAKDARNGIAAGGHRVGCQESQGGGNAERGGQGEARGNGLSRYEPCTQK